MNKKHLSRFDRITDLVALLILVGIMGLQNLIDDIRSL